MCVPPIHTILVYIGRANRNNTKIRQVDPLQMFMCFYDPIYIQTIMTLFDVSVNICTNVLV